MKKIFLLTGLATFVTVCFIGGCHTNGLAEHLLFLGPAIAVLRIACGKEEDKSSRKTPANISRSFTFPTQLELEFEFDSKAVVNA